VGNQNDNDIGGKVGLDISEFKTGVSELNRQIRVIDSGFKAAAAGMEDWGSNADGLKSRISSLGQIIDAQKKKVALLTDEYARVAKEKGESSKEAQDLQVWINKETAAFNKNELELRKNVKALDSLGTESADAGKEVEKAGSKAEKSGKDAEKGESGWSKLTEGLGKVGKAAGLAVAGLAAAAAGAAVGLGKAVVESFGELEQNLGGSEAVFGQYAKSIQKTGEDAYKNLGVSQSEYLATANKVGALFQGAGLDQQTSLKLTEKALQRATDAASVMGIDTSAALEAITGAAKGNYTMMDNLGVAMNETSLKAYALSKGLDYGDISKDQAKKAELAMEYFFEKTAQYEGNFAREATESVSGSFGLLSASWESMLAGFGNKDADMSNLTSNFVSAIKAVISNVMPIVDNIVQTLPTVFSALIPAISGILPQLLSTAASLFESLLVAIIALLPTLIPVVVDALLLITNTLVENLPLIIDAAMTLVVTLAQGIASALPELIPTLVDTVMMIVDTLVDNVDILVTAAITIIMALATGLIDALPRLIKAAPRIIRSLVDALLENLPLLIDAAITLIIELAKAIVQNLPLLAQASVEIIGALVKALVNGIPQILGIIPQLFSEMVKGFAAIDWGKLGKAIVDGIKNGVKNAAKGLADSVVNAASGALTGVKDFLGIRSPSRVMRDEVGTMIGAGMAQGITRSTNQVRAAMGGLTEQMTTAGPAAYSAGGGNSGAVAGVSPTILVNIPVALDGRVVTSSTSRIQLGQNRSRARALGVAVP